MVKPSSAELVKKHRGLEMKHVKIKLFNEPETRRRKRICCLRFGLELDI